MTNGTDKNSSFIFPTRRGSGPHLVQGKSFVIVNCCVPILGYLSSKLYTEWGICHLWTYHFLPLLLRKNHGIQMCISRSLNKDLVSKNVLFNQNVIAFYRKLARRKCSTPSVYPIVKKSVLGSFAKKIEEKLALLAKIAVLKFIKSKGHFLVMVKFTSSRRSFSR